MPLTQKLLEVPAELIATALDLELQDGTVIADDLEGRRCIFLAALYRAAHEIAEKLKTLAVGKPPWPAIDVDKAIPWVEQRTKLALADSQKAALRVALVSNVMVITGGPGVGKTTLVNSLLRMLTAKGVTIALSARPYRSRRQAPVREHWPRGENHSSLARNRPQDRHVPAQRGRASRL